MTSSSDMRRRGLDFDVEAADVKAEIAAADRERVERRQKLDAAYASTFSTVSGKTVLEDLRRKLSGPGISNEPSQILIEEGGRRAFANIANAAFRGEKLKGGA